jgi:hypothetical protein
MVQGLLDYAKNNPRLQSSASAVLATVSMQNAKGRTAVARAGGVPAIVRALKDSDSSAQRRAVCAAAALAGSSADYHGQFVAAGLAEAALPLLLNGQLQALQTALLDMPRAPEGLLEAPLGGLPEAHL